MCYAHVISLMRPSKKTTLSQLYMIDKIISRSSGPFTRCGSGNGFLLCGCGNGKVMYKHECFTLPLPHRMGSKPIYLRQCCRSRNSVNTHIESNTTHLLRQKKKKNVDVAAPCERTFHLNKFISPRGRTPG